MIISYGVCKSGERVTALPLESLPFPVSAQQLHVEQEGSRSSGGREEESQGKEKVILLSL